MKIKSGMFFAIFILIWTFMALTATSIFAAGRNKPKVNEHKPELKNVIIMISDGCGANEILATDYYIYGGAGMQIYEQFSTKVSMSTYSLGEITKDDDALGFYDPNRMWSSFDEFKKYPTDSAAAATAMATGVKTYNGAIGFDQDQNRLRSIVEDFEDLGRSTGVVTSVGFSHATPAGFVAHNDGRNNLSDIALEMLMESRVDVIMGSGNPYYDNSGNLKGSVTDKDFNYVGGRDAWDSLVAGSLGNDANNDGNLEYWHLIQGKAEFEALESGDTPARVIGVAQAYDTLQQARDGDAKADAYQVPFNANVPQLSVMAKGALNVLDNDQDGFFLMIEGGAVDKAGHANQNGRLIEEEQSFNLAVEAVCQWVEANSSWDETLVIVTGDHETGYLTGVQGVYGEVVNNGQGIMPGMAWNSGSHTNQLVPFFAKGFGSRNLVKAADESDPVKGRYLDNTEISQVIRSLLR